MDPVGPWSAYTSYNRLAGVQSGTSGSDLHHITSATTSASPSATTQLLSSSFLSPPPAGYEAVFNPLFHHTNAKPPAHYVAQLTPRPSLVHAQTSIPKQSEGDYHQSPQTFFDQNPSAWQPNSPFGILPHETIPTTSIKSTSYDNFSSHFAASQNHLTSQLTAATVSKNPSTRSESPHATTSNTKPIVSQDAGFFQGTNYPSSDSPDESKTFPSGSNSSLQHSCIVTTPSNTATSKEYRTPQPNSRTSFLSSPTPQTRTTEKMFAPPSTKSTTSVTPVLQKTQAKNFPEINSQSERPRGTDDAQNQVSQISFPGLDTTGRVNYSSNSSTSKRAPTFQQSSYSHYQHGTNQDQNDFHRPKPNQDYNTPNGSDCNVGVPRRASPLQTHSQASPIGHAQSPVYPMYNSPMNSLSSPQQASNNQVAPPSPLDVSVQRSNSQTGSIVYPSVITRALNMDKSLNNDRYDRSQQNQNCWDDRRKYTSPNSSNASYSSPNSLEIPQRQLDVPNRPTETASRSSSHGERSYFESPQQVPLQDLSSCRGDPMSIVKNLQQQSCQVQATDVKHEDKIPISINKHRKSIEKTPSPAISTSNTVDYYAGRIPPPAHSSIPNQQQQNGGYYDYERWSIPPSSSKIFSPHQHQNIMASHPHAHHPNPLPYFTSFMNHPEYSGPPDVSPVNNTVFNEQPSQTAPDQYTEPPVQEDSPKVVVPNIEEELNFLAEPPMATADTKVTTKLAIVPNKNKPNGQGTGFMNSYLKFLQGERDCSPPPAARGGRKPSWSRQTNSKTFLQSDLSNDSNSLPLNQSSTHTPMQRLSQGDPQDDPRYFPLPKERKRNSFEDSDENYSSEEEIFSKKRHNPPLVEKQPPPKEKKGTGRKGRPCKPGGPTERKRARLAALAAAQAAAGLEVKGGAPVEQNNAIQRREASKRAAKEKIDLKQILAKSGELEDETQEFMDSDSDPAWTPRIKEEGEEDALLPKKRGRKPKLDGKKRGPKPSQYPLPPGRVEGDQPPPKRRGRPPLSSKIDQNATTPQITNEDNSIKPGEFVVIKSELNQEWPAIWKVDGKNLLQKYEPFEQNGNTLYRNISTYTSWTPESKKQYLSIPIRYVSQGQMETVVEFLKSEITIIDTEFMETVMKDHERYQDNFEVYIQTLISQALDSNFLTEIFQEQDDYFLSNVKTIDDITQSKKVKLLNLLRWPQPVQAAISTWPCFNVIREISTSDAQTKICGACIRIGVAVRVLMYGQPYNSTTLEGCQVDLDTVSEKDFFMCRICANKVELFNKITHQKYLMYVECAKRVAEKRVTDPHKDTTCILNELLADEQWLSQLFLDVRSTWAEVDSLDHSYQTKNQKPDQPVV